VLLDEAARKLLAIQIIARFIGRRCRALRTFADHERLAACRQNHSSAMLVDAGYRLAASAVGAAIVLHYVLQFLQYHTFLSYLLGIFSLGLILSSFNLSFSVSGATQKGRDRSMSFMTGFFSCLIDPLLLFASNACQRWISNQV
jgi:hypothetical protein